MKIGIALFFALLLTGAASVRADENFCGHLSGDELEFRYVQWSDQRTALEFSVPLRKSKAKFHKTTVVLGANDSGTSFEIDMENSHARANGVLHLPREHGRVRIQAVYHQKACFLLLEAELENSRRKS